MNMDVQKQPLSAKSLHAVVVSSLSENSGCHATLVKWLPFGARSSCLRYLYHMFQGGISKGERVKLLTMLPMIVPSRPQLHHVTVQPLDPHCEDSRIRRPQEVFDFVS